MQARAQPRRIVRWPSRPPNRKPERSEGALEKSQFLPETGRIAASLSVGLRRRPFAWDGGKGHRARPAASGARFDEHAIGAVERVAPEPGEPLLRTGRQGIQEAVRRVAGEQVCDQHECRHHGAALGPRDEVSRYARAAFLLVSAHRDRHVYAMLRPRVFPGHSSHWSLTTPHVQPHGASKKRPRF